jgi:antitoxin ParD1/3/4
MQVALTPEQEQLVSRKLLSGRYRSANEVIEEGLRLLAEQDALIDLGLTRLRQDIATGLQQLKAGLGIPGEQVFEELRQRSAERRTAQG